MFTINSVAHASRANREDDITVTTIHQKFMHIVHGSGDDRNLILVRDEVQAAALIVSIKAISAALDWNLE
jgi:hypothetical protein